MFIQWNIIYPQKEWGTDSYNNIGEAQKHGKKSVTKTCTYGMIPFISKHAHMAWFLLYEMSRLSKSIERESRFVAA